MAVATIGGDIPGGDFGEGDVRGSDVGGEARLRKFGQLVERKPQQTSMNLVHFSLPSGKESFRD